MQMQCFSVVRDVLDDLYKKIETKHRSSSIALINEKLKYFDGVYKGKEIDVDYSDPLTRFAYIFRYTAAHANMVFQAIDGFLVEGVKQEGFEELQNIFRSKMVNITCLAGGPRSDILGVLKYLSSLDVATNLKELKYTIIDREVKWSQSWYNVEGRVDKPRNFHTSSTFLPIDVTNPDSYFEHGALTDADLFTMIFFISELFQYREDAQEFFEKLFENAKTGALFLFIDNSIREFYNWFDEIAVVNGLEIIYKERYLKFQTEFDEEMKVLGPYYQLLETDPRIRGKISYRVYRKYNSYVWSAVL